MNVDEVMVGDTWVNGEDEIFVTGVEPYPGGELTRITGRIVRGPDASDARRAWVWPNQQRVEVRRDD